MSSKNEILLYSTAISKWGYPYFSKNERENDVAVLYEKRGIFIWDDVEEAFGNDYQPPNPFYKLKTGKTSRPFIPLSLEEINYIINHPTEIKICKCFSEIKSHLKSRNFNAARLLLPELGKLNKSDYSHLTDVKLVSDEKLLRLFKIE